MMKMESQIFKNKIAILEKRFGLTEPLFLIGIPIPSNLYLLL